jgi:tetratricopeptide (TPR) repeat protein
LPAWIARFDGYCHVPITVAGGAEGKYFRFPPVPCPGEESSMSRKKSIRQEARRQAQMQAPALWRTSLRTMVIPAAVIVVAVVLAYIPALQGDFIWDDPKYVSENPILRDPGGLSRIWTELGATVQYYPLVFTTFWFEYRLWGLDTFGYHLVNVLLHAASAILLWRVLCRLSVPGAWLAAAIFALHPIQVESVAWITERKNVLAGFFYLAAALSYLHFEPRDFVDAREQRRWKLYLLALALFLAALFSKTVTCSLPAAILLLIWWKRGRILLPRLVPLIPMFIVGAALASVTAWMEKNNVRTGGADWDFSWLERCLIAGRALWFYIGKLLLPINLTFNYPRWQIDTAAWWQYLFPLTALALVVVLWILRKRIGRAPLISAFFYGGTVLPALGFTNTYPMRYSFVADHFQYLACIGPITLAAAFLNAKLVERQRGSAGRYKIGDDRALPNSFFGVAAVVVVFLAVLSSGQARIYENRQTLWEDTLKINPESFLGHNNLGTIYLEMGRTNLAFRHFSEAVRIKPDFHEAQSNLGRIYMMKGMSTEGVAHCAEAVRLKPDSFEAHYNLANALAQEEDLTTAVDHFERASALRPQNAMVHNNLANALAQLGRFEDAARHYREAIALKPDYALAHRNLGLALSAQDDIEGAIFSYRKSLQLRPEDAMAHYNLGELLEKQGDREGAGHEYQAALRIDPRHTPARRALEALQSVPAGQKQD